MQNASIERKIQLLGRGTWVKGVAARDGSDITVILANYDPVGRHNETTPVTFTNINPGNYEIERQSFGGATNKQQIATSSSALQISVPMGANTAVFIRLRPL